MPLRVMWLLNHSTARKFEIPMLKSIGVEEIFQPKLYPSDPAFRSASVDWSEDRNLTIPPEDLAVMNAARWYGGADENAWRIASRHFDVCFFIVYDLEVFRAATKYFRGALLWRTFGLQKGHSYSNIMHALEQGIAWDWINRLGRRFFFAKGYAHIDRVEADVLKRRSVHLPLGLHDAAMDDCWQGGDKRIFFVCPDIGFNHYYRDIYTQFIADFHGMPYVIGGAQPVAVDDPAVLGFVPHATHQENMRQLRLMFYHSTDPDHIHYHPLEAIRAGMPLLFMADGMLDRMGGTEMPGRCRTVDEARSKARRILADDRTLIGAIRRQQPRLLESMKPENCAAAWREGFARVAADLAVSRRQQGGRAARPRRIAVILPISYRGGTLRGAKLLAEAIELGSREAGETAEVVLAYPDDTATYADPDFADLPPAVRCRPFRWKRLSAAEARRGMRYAGHASWQPRFAQYLVADDGIRQLLDCDVWLVVSDRLSAPLLPVRPSVVMVYDYLQRYFPILPHGADAAFLLTAQLAQRVLVTTRATERDALDYAGIPAGKLVKLPVLAPMFTQPRRASRSSSSYLVWTTNAAIHKNHFNTLAALKRYYERLDGRLDCLVTGHGTRDLMRDPPGHLQRSAQLVAESETLRQRVTWRGELDEQEYQSVLQGAAFLLHATSVDNGTLSVVEAASLGVPSLSSDYAAIREIDEQFSLNLAWMNPDDPVEMAEQLKKMELTCMERRRSLPSAEELSAQQPARLGGQYWAAVRSCL